MGYDKGTFIDTVYHAAKRKGIDIKYLERTAGVSIGYLSRMRANNSVHASPTLRVMVSMSDTLGIGLDALLKGDFRSVAHDEQNNEIKDDTGENIKSTNKVWCFCPYCGEQLTNKKEGK